jgi:hypothetical protein
MRSPSRQPLIRLSEKWGIGADHVQWIVMQYRAPDWRPLSFVATTKAVLLRCLREKEADISAKGQLALDSLPEDFQTWNSRRRTAVYGAVAPSDAVG